MVVAGVQGKLGREQVDGLGSQSLGLEDNSTACWKNVHYRGIGKFHEDCTGDDVEESMGLCYPKCGEHSTGHGPFCWDNCPGEFDVELGAMCCAGTDTCREKIFDMAVKIPIDVVRLYQDQANWYKVIADAKKLFHDTKDLVFPQCDSGSHHTPDRMSTLK